MRRPQLALFSGIGRRVALAVAACGVLALTAALLLQAGAQLRQYRALHQEQLRQTATLAAIAIRSRINSADMVMRALTASEAGTADAKDAAGVRAALMQTGMFSWYAELDLGAGGFASSGQHQFHLDAQDRDTLEADRTAVLQATDASGVSSMFLARRAGSASKPGLLVAEISRNWLWMPLRGNDLKVPFVGLDASGREYASTLENAADIDGFLAQRLAAKPGTTSEDLSWSARGSAWVGAAARVETSFASNLSLVIVAADLDRSWSASLLSAAKTQGPLLLAVLLMALSSAYLVASRYVGFFRQLRRALVHLPERRPAPLSDPGTCKEIKQLVDTFNRSAEEIVTQRETQHVMSQIDTLLLAGGDFENIIDLVLTRVRDLTQANNVGLTLIDPGISGHGRLFAVNADGGFPVNRVVLDDQMAATLRESKTGLTVVRCESVRHSFLTPLQAAGSGFFWVWPVIVADNLAAILAVGYVEPPSNGVRVAACGTQCAQRLAISLSSNARADQLYRQAHFDPLTQLPNRLLFRDRLAQELASVNDAPSRGALLYIDLDHFKKVNDSLGHEAGDQLLSIVAQRLRACVKEGDTVARLAGDEFTIILRHVADAAAASAVADRILQSMQMPVRLGGQDHHVRASVGVVLFPDDGSQFDELLRKADLAMYRAKDLGRGAAMFYNSRMSEHGARVADSGLYRALKRREFSLYYQPQYSVADGSLMGVEALLRWQTPRDGLLASADFIPAAEESGLIIDLGGWVLEAACMQIAQWREQGIAVPRVAVNLSVQQLRDPALPSNLQRLLERFRIHPASLEFELKEAALTDHDSQTCIAQISAIGVGLTLDDFGTGHTALANLRRYPVSAVKIDRSFVDEISVNPAAAALASTIIVMAHGVDKIVVAEGVETIEQLDFLRERGCDVAQGFFMAHPLSAAAMTDLLEGRTPGSNFEISATA